jgi:acetyl esterase/lipase
VTTRFHFTPNTSWSQSAGSTIVSRRSKKEHTMKTTFTAIAATLALGLAASIPAAEQLRFNILFILADDLGKEWISCYGAEDSAHGRARQARDGVRPGALPIPALLLIALCGASLAAESPAQGRFDGPVGTPCIYKTSAGQERRMEIFFPPDHAPATSKVPGMILFHGGGWSGGTLAQFRVACAYFASRGLVCATAEYQMLDKAARYRLFWRSGQMEAGLGHRLREMGGTRRPC